MRIGIITWHDVVNYGAILQAYATQRVLESWGHTSVLLRYTRLRYSDGNKRNNLIGKVFSFIRNQTPNRIMSRHGYAVQAEAFDVFRRKFLNIGDLYSKERNLDAVVIGSDQIFDIKHGYNSFQYGEDVPCEHIVAYAPSFGETMIEDVEKSGHKEEMKALLGRMKGLSARDKNTQNIIHALTGKRPEIVVDSALLYGFEKEATDWVNTRPVSKPYLAVYLIMGVTTDRAYCEAVKRFARKHGLITVSVGERRGWCDMSYPAASPEEFVQLIQQSRAVVTNTLHGTIFSVLLSKPFYVSYRGYNTNKLYHLLSWFSLTSCIKNYAEELLLADLPDIDFAALNNTLVQRRQQSSDYLQKALKK